MEKFKRNERVGAIIKILGDNPNKVITYNYFSDLFTAAKSSISEDIIIVKKIIQDLKMGEVVTVPGAAGGVKYLPITDRLYEESFINSMCEKLRDSSRIIPGGYIYYTDFLYSPEIVDQIGRIIASRYVFKNIDYVVTMETKGIPIALMTARYLNRPLAIVRRQNKVTDGATVSINYTSGTSGKISTISISRKSIKNGSKVIIVDDFMKGGGTTLGMINLLNEFDCKVEGITVLIASKDPEDKLVSDYDTLMVLEKLDQKQNIINIEPYTKKNKKI